MTPPPHPARPDHEFPELADLAVLLNEGTWRYPMWLSPDGPLAGVRQGPAVTEVIIITSPQNVTVARLYTEDWVSHQQGDVRAVLWVFTGSLSDAVNELRALPPHGSPNAPRLRLTRPCDFQIPKKQW